MINKLNIEKLQLSYSKSKPFNYVIIDNFWEEKYAHLLVKEIESMSLNDHVTKYKSPLEKKTIITRWDVFKKQTYKAFHFLYSDNFIKIVKKITNINDIQPDNGLHGGGLHFHPRGGNLNIHKDYSIHPKIDKERRLNIIIYMNQEWKKNWGGHLELWSHDDKKDKPKKMEKKVINKFNRAIIFDTTQNSWHGLPYKTEQPKNINRQSMALYYLSEPRQNISKRTRAYFIPRKEQENNKKVLSIIKKRAGL